MFACMSYFFIFVYSDIMASSVSFLNGMLYFIKSGGASKARA
jgi:hypothetical protein